MLRLRYVEALEPAAVQRELRISRAQLYRERTRALDALTSLLAEQWPVDPDVRGDFELRAGLEPIHGTHHARGLPSAVAGDTSRRDLRAWHPLLLFLLFGASWAAAWFAVWTFAQTMPWPAAWGVGGAVSGLATGLLLRKSDAGIGWNRVRVVALGWTAAWVVAWLVGRSVATLMDWAVRSELLAGLDANDPAYAVGRIAAWAGAGLLVGVMAQAVPSPSRWPTAGMASLAWVVAGCAGHGLFWALDPSLFTPGERFAVSGLCEGAIGGGTTLWLLGRARTVLGGALPNEASAG